MKKLLRYPMMLGLMGLIALMALVLWAIDAAIRLYKRLLLTWVGPYICRHKWGGMSLRANDAWGTRYVCCSHCRTLKRPLEIAK